MVLNKRLNIRSVLKELEIKGLSLFTPNIFAKVFKINLSTATIFLSRNTRLGYFVRLKKGTYSPTNLQPSPLEIANLIYKPSYISLEIALSFYHIIPETIYSITSITTKHSKEVKVFNQIFSYHRLSRKLYFGYEFIRAGNKKILIATKEKAFLDYLYFVALGQKKYNERLDIRIIDKKKILKYSQIYFKSIKNSYIKKRFALLLKKLNLQ
jgi:predicted transcriptional regulator of viral defense system